MPLDSINLDLPESRLTEAKTAFYHLRLGLKSAWQRFFKPRYWYADRWLLAYEGKFRGQTCVIVGNGPSLNRTNTALLKDAYTFGANRIYLGIESLGFTPTFYVCVNDLVIEQCWDDIVRLPMPKFLSSRFRSADKPAERMIWMRTDGVPGAIVAFSDNPVHGVFEGHTVTFVAMQLAYWLGFKKVILVGVDHNFTTKGEANATVVTQESDPNHFRPDYFGKGFRWQLPDLEASEAAYRLADYVFRRTGREIVDCTVDGKCQVFRKSTLEVELAGDGEKP